jgi:hypothetical protein
MESVAAERLNKLGQNPNIISNRQDLKIDQEALKEVVAHATPILSTDDSDSEIVKHKGALPKNSLKVSAEKESIKKLLAPNLYLPKLLKAKSPSTPSKLNKTDKKTESSF